MRVLILRLTIQKTNFFRKKTVIIDQDKNKTFLDNFDYQVGINTSKSIGNIEVIDDKNKYEFSQVYIDTKKEILGTDIKSFLNDQSFKIDQRNKPRVFANTLKLINKILNLIKVFLLYVTIGKKINVLLGLSKHQKCFMTVKKTIYYDNAVIKVYDLPIFIYRNYHILIPQ